LKRAVHPAIFRGMESATTDAKRDQRRRQIVRAAYDTIAAEGFAGLRMRAIAERAGMDHATLHYYFAGKAAVVDGVLDYIISDLAIGRGPRTARPGLTPRELLVAHFEELMRQVEEQPAMFIVLAEVNTLAMRDPAIREHTARNDRRWRGFLATILRDGVAQGQFLASLDIAATAQTLVAVLRSLTTAHLGRADRMRGPLRQILAWIDRPGNERA
jgi:AcrR family transcriptional regulator